MSTMYIETKTKNWLFVLCFVCAYVVSLSLSLVLGVQFTISLSSSIFFCILVDSIDVMETIKSTRHVGIF